VVLAVAVLTYSALCCIGIYKGRLALIRANFGVFAVWIVLHAFTGAVYFIAGNVVAGAIDIVCIIIGFMGIWLNYKLIMQRLAARRARKAVHTTRRAGAGAGPGPNNAQRDARLIAPLATAANDVRCA
jgi:hypothetical protein